MKQTTKLTDVFFFFSHSPQLIDLLMRVILDPGDVIINTPPTFGMYAFDCAVNGEAQV